MSRRDRRKGYLAQGAYIMGSYNGGVYHIADKGGRLYLCGCSRDAELHNRLGLRFGMRSQSLSPKRNSDHWL